EKSDLLTDEWRDGEHLHEAAERHGIVWSAAAIRNVRTAAGQHAPHIREGVVPDIVEDDVVAIVAGREVRLRVVDDVIRTERAYHLEVASALHAGHVRATCLRERH